MLIYAIHILISTKQTRMFQNTESTGVNGEIKGKKKKKYGP